MSEVGVLLARLRRDAGYSQERLAEALGVDRTYVSLVETGRRNPSRRYLTGLAAALHVSPAELLRRVGWLPDTTAQESDLAAIVSAHPELGDVFAFARQHPEILPQLVTYGKFLIQELGEDEPGSAAATGDTA